MSAPIKAHPKQNDAPEQTPAAQFPIGAFTLRIYQTEAGVTLAIFDPKRNEETPVGDIRIRSKSFRDKTFSKALFYRCVGEHAPFDRIVEPLLLPEDIDPVEMLPDGSLYCTRCHCHVENTANAEMRKEGYYAHSHICPEEVDEP